MACKPEACATDYPAGDGMPLMQTGKSVKAPTLSRRRHQAAQLKSPQILADFGVVTQFSWPQGRQAGKKCARAERGRRGRRESMECFRYSSTTVQAFSMSSKKV
jgi:hypothetical protein